MGRWDAARPARDAKPVLFLLPRRPLFPVSAFFHLFRCCFLPDILCFGGGALMSPAQSGSKAPLALLHFMGQKLKFPCFLDEGGGEEGGRVSFYASEKTSKSCR